MNELKNILEKTNNDLSSIYYFARGEEPESNNCLHNTSPTQEQTKKSELELKERKKEIKAYNKKYGVIHTNIYPNGSIYRGEWDNGNKNGKGTLIIFEKPERFLKFLPLIGLYNRYGNILTDSNIKDEPIIDNAFILGHKKKPKKKKHYDGEWKDDEFHGKGIYTGYGEYYNGEWVEGRKHGVGNYIGSNGE